MRTLGILWFIGLTAALEAQELPPLPQRAQEGTPLFLQGLELRDPFTGKTQKLWELEEKIELTTKEIELLRLEIEKAKLWQQYIQITGGKPPGTALQPEQPPTPQPKTRARPRVPSRPTAPSSLQVLAVIYGEQTQRAHVRVGRTSAWVQPGDHIGGWEIVAVREDGVVARWRGQTRFFPVRS